MSFGEVDLCHPNYISWLQDPDVVRTLNLPKYLEQVVTFEELKSYWRAMSNSENDLFLSIRLIDGDEFIGTAKVGHINWYAGTADIGIMIGRKDLWGEGLASEALCTLCKYLFECTKIRRLTAGVMSINPAMVRVFEKLGFRREGVFREHDRLGDNYFDHIHLGCLREEFQVLCGED